MSLYWKDLEIVPGMLLEVDQYQHEAFDSSGKPVPVTWKILAFDSRKSNETYYNFTTGKKYSLEKVMKSRKLQAKLNLDILQIPACSDFMIVQEYHGGKEVYKRCYSLDMLGTVRSIRLVDRK